MPWSNKDPDEIVDRHVNWASSLPTGVTITDSEWTIPAGLTKDADSFATTFTTVRLSAGVINMNYALLNRVTLSNGEVLERTTTQKIKAK